MSVGFLSAGAFDGRRLAENAGSLKTRCASVSATREKPCAATYIKQLDAFGPGSS